MTELSARLGLYAAIDEAAEGRGTMLDAVAEAIPVYRPDRDGSPVDERRGALGWSRDLASLLPDQAVESLERSLAELGFLESPRPLDQARRLKAIWALSQTMPGIDRALRAGALVPLVDAARSAAHSGEGGGSSDETLVADAERLAELLEDPKFPAGETFPEVVEVAVDRHFISAEVAQLASIGCEDSVTFVEVVRDGEVDVDPAAHIVSTVQGFEVGSRTLGDLERLLDPANWSTCLGSFWCAMAPLGDPGKVLGNGIRGFQEQVGDCPAVWFMPYLVFATVRRPSTGDQVGFDLQYDLCRDAALMALSNAGSVLSQDRRVEVDAGSVIVERSRGTTGSAPGRVDITTSKTIRFAEPLPTGGIALLACISGWADLTREMMTGCLRTGP